ncbi:MAG: P-II family nitrogen regulator [Oscillospiraceae bacterium]|nr:P-II family nitrogen regulator [Oscillospiraceae bacterium]MDD4414191.1 P-II family nitrogen regulator [Oscillospiraceae bacterium]
MKNNIDDTQKNHINDAISIELIYVIVNFGMGSKVLQAAKKNGINEGTIFLGRGTVSNTVLNFLSVYDERKEIVLMGTDKGTAHKVLDMLNNEFKFEKPNHGIAFSTSAGSIIGSKSYNCDENVEERGAINPMYQLIITIVDRGKAEEVIDAANAAGSKGGTIINARGSGIHETMKLFNMDIEPEKEMVMILSGEEVTESIIDSIREKLEIDKQGKGIIFCQNVNKVYGIYK